MSVIPFIDLKAQYQSIKEEIRVAMDAVLENATFILGPAVAAFEKKFAAYVGVKHAVGVNSGTSALHLALLAAGVGPGDEVIVPAMTFIATASAVDYTGATPVFVDVDPVSYTIDITKIAAKITKRTKVIMPVHLYGQPADMDPIMEIARRHGLLVIEDAAQAHGAEYKGGQCGSIGDIAGFSFYPGKNLGAFGEGGAITTNRDDFAEKVRMLRDWGQRKKGEHEIQGFNYRLEGLQGAVLGVKLNHIERWNEGRRRAAADYDQLLKGVPGVVTPQRMEYAKHVYHVYAILAKDRDRVAKALQEKGISTNVHYPKPVHLQKCFASLGYKRGDLPVAERLAENELSLPIYPELTDELAREVVGALRKAV